MLKQSVPGIRVFKFAENETVGLDRGLVMQAKSERGDLGMVEEIIVQRRDVLDRIVNSLLKDGYFLIANRWITSTLAYQTLGGELSMQHVWDMHVARDVRIPSLVVMTNCSVETALERESARAAGGHREIGLSGRMTSGLEKRRKLHEQYGLVGDFLRSKNVEVLEVNTELPDSLLLNTSLILDKIANVVTPLEG